MTPAATGARNMAVDEAMLQAVERGDAPPTLRLYTWEPGCFSLGRFQRASDLAEDARRDVGVTWVRRPTGGRALYHGPELTYSVAARLDDGHVSGTVLESYRKIGVAILLGLRAMGVDAQMAPPGDARRAASNPACFDNPAAYEVLWQGRKLAGSAQVRSRGALLQHGSIMLSDPTPTFFAGLVFADEQERILAERRGRARLATLEDALGAAPEPSHVIEAIVRGFEESWHISLEAGELRPAELETAEDLERHKYVSAEWSYRK